MIRNSKRTLKKTLLTVCALILISSLLLCTVYASSSAPLVTRTVTDRDEKFPLSLDPVIDSASIRLLPSNSSVSDDMSVIVAGVWEN